MIHTKRCLIKPITWDDFDDYVESSQDPDVVRHIGNGKVLSREEHYKKWEERMAYMQENPGFGVFCIFSKDNGDCIGTCNLNQLDKTNFKHVGYRIKKEYWGQGYATEAARALISYAFNTMNMESVSAVVDDNHYASQNVLEKAGLTKIGYRTFFEMNLLYYEIRKEDYAQL